MVINTQPCCVRNPFSLSLNHFFGLSLCILRSRSIHRVHNLIAVEIRVHFEIKWVYVYVYVYVYMYVRMYVSIYIQITHIYAHFIHPGVSIVVWLTNMMTAKPAASSCMPHACSLGFQLVFAICQIVPWGLFQFLQEFRKSMFLLFVRLFFVFPAFLLCLFT